MSRYAYTPPRWPRHMEFAVGWDPALETFFAQVMDHSMGHDDDCVVVWLGGLPPHYRCIDELMRTLNRRLAGELPEVSLSKSMRAKLIRDRRFKDADEAPHSTLAKGELMPPVCLMASATVCRACRKVTPVYTLAAADFRFAEDAAPIGQRVTVQDVSYLPAAVQSMFRKRVPCYRFGQDDPESYPCLMNRCRHCRAAIPDRELHRDYGGAFPLPEPDDRRKFRLFALPVTDPVPVYGGVLFGIVDYPAIEAAEPWQSSLAGEPAE